MLLKSTCLALAAIMLASTSFARSSTSQVCTSVGEDAVMDYYFKDSLKDVFSTKYRRQFRDKTRGSYPSPEAIEKAEIKIPMKMEIRGSSTQAGIYPGAYRFDVFNEGGVAVIEVRVYLKNQNAIWSQQVQGYLRDAEEGWNRSKPAYGFAYRFRFKVVDNAKEAHFQVNLKPHTRGPYFKNFDPLYWSASSYMHEIGHMMGLVDEYEVMTRKDNCDATSLWCNEDWGATGIKPFHYYMILRKIVMDASGCHH